MQNLILIRMVIFSDEIFYQKMTLYLKILIFLDSFAKYLASGSTLLCELSPNMVGLNSALHSASNDTIFDQAHQANIFHSLQLHPHLPMPRPYSLKKFCLMTLLENSIISPQNLMLDSIQPCLDSTHII